MRLDWANQHTQHNLRFWRRIHWSDEFTFMLHQVDGRLRVWRLRGKRYNPDCVLETASSGRVSVAVWGCVSFHCKLPLVDLHGNMTAARYRDEVLVPWLEPHMDGHALADRPIFQQDKAPPNTARLAIAFLPNSPVDVLPWPSMSPDMNIIEHVWSHIASQINMMEHMPATAHDLRQCIHAIWRDIPQV